MATRSKIAMLQPAFLNMVFPLIFSGSTDFGYLSGIAGTSGSKNRR